MLGNDLNCTFMLLCVAPKRYDSFWEQRNFPDAFLSARDSFFRGFLDSPNLEIHDQILKNWKQIQYDSLGKVIYEATFENDVLAKETLNERKNIEHMPYLVQCAHIQEEEARKTCPNTAL